MSLNNKNESREGSGAIGGADMLTMNFLSGMDAVAEMGLMKPFLIGVFYLCLALSAVIYLLDYIKDYENESVKSQAATYAKKEKLTAEKARLLELTYKNKIFTLNTDMTPSMVINQSHGSSGVNGTWRGSIQGCGRKIGPDVRLLLKSDGKDHISGIFQFFPSFSVFVSDQAGISYNLARVYEQFIEFKSDGQGHISDVLKFFQNLTILHPSSDTEFGSYRVSGEIQGSNVILHAGDWIVQPQGYKAFDFVLTVGSPSLKPQQMTGKVTKEGCESVRLSGLSAKSVKEGW